MFRPPNPLRDAANPPSTEYVNVSGRSFNTVFPNDLQYFETLNAIIQREPIGAIGPEVRGEIASIGIVKGKKFEPDDRMKKLLTEAGTLGNATARVITAYPRIDGVQIYPDTDSSWIMGFANKNTSFEADGAMTGGHDEKEQTLNQLLVELDGFDPSTGLVLLAATNRPEVLDPALLRAGRFDRQVLVDRPDKSGRLQILGVHLKKVKLAADVSPEKVAALTPGFTGADLANLVNEAALLATRRRAEAVTMADFNDAVERIVAGLEKRNRLLNPREREIVAYHEMGHG